MTLLLFSGSVVAQAPPALPLTLHLHAPAECPDVPAIQQEVATLLARPTEALAQGLTAYLRVSRSSQTRTAWQVHLQLDFHDGTQAERTLSGEDCDTLLRASALVLALSLDPALLEATLTPPWGADSPDPPADAGTSPSADEGAEQLTRPAPVESPPETQPDRAFESNIESSEQSPTESAPVSSDSVSRSRLGAPPPSHSAVFLRLGGLFRVLPSASPELELGYAFQWRRLLVRFGLAAGWPQRETAATDSTAGVRVGLGVARIAVLGRIRLRHLLLDGGLLVEGGVLGARGMGVDSQRLGFAPWFTAGTELGLGLEVGALVLRVGAAFRVPLNRPLFLLEEVGPVFRPPPWSTSVHLGISWRFL